MHHDQCSSPEVYLTKGKNDPWDSMGRFHPVSWVIRQPPRSAAPRPVGCVGRAPAPSPPSPPPQRSRRSWQSRRALQALQRGEAALLRPPETRRTSQVSEAQPGHPNSATYSFVVSLSFTTFKYLCLTSFILKSTNYKFTTYSLKVKP